MRAQGNPLSPTRPLLADAADGSFRDGAGGARRDSDERPWLTRLRAAWLRRDKPGSADWLALTRRPGAAAQCLAAGEFQELVRAIRAGATYVNVHTEGHPGGEIRAQLDGDNHSRDNDND